MNDRLIRAKRESLVVCRKLWQWLAKDGKRNVKHEWPGWKELGKTMCWCPCCQFAKDATYANSNGEILSRSCAFCPLLGYAWREIKNSDQDHPPCAFDPKSPYLHWGRFAGASKDAAHQKLATQEALKIVDACTRAIADIDAEIAETFETKPMKFTPSKKTIKAIKETTRKPAKRKKPCP